MIDIDQKRTGVKASSGPWSEPPCFIHDGRWYSTPGYIIFVEKTEPLVTGSYYLACPGCGQIGTPRDKQQWKVNGGTLDDVTTLSLLPSIKKNCCGWHGYLTNGVFESC